MVKTTWICYVHKTNANREAREIRAIRRKKGFKPKISVEQRGKGTALNKFRTAKGSRYVETDKHFCVVEK